MFADELQAFLGQCQAFVGAMMFATDWDARGGLDETVRVLPKARTPGHYRLLRSVISDFVEACARASPESERLKVTDWSDAETLAATFRSACEGALFERAWSERAASALIHRALAEIRRRGTDRGFSATIVAGSCGVSRPYLLRVFRRELGVSFAMALRRHRIGIAQRRLVAGDESIKEVALTVGYNSCDRFIREFRRETGLTPGEFRAAESHHPGAERA